jgi:diadenylate cyclase
MGPCVERLRSSYNAPDSVKDGRRPAVIPFFDNLHHTLRVADVADILVMASVLYLSLQWLRRRATRGLAAALGALAVVYVAARVFNMYLTLMVFQTGLTVLVVSMVVIFQQDIRRTFEQLSSWRGFHGSRIAENWAALLDDLIDAASTMAKQKIGALIVLAGRQPLDPHVEGGVVVKGRISTPLLFSIFHPATPGHDGAVVIDRDRIEMLGVYLPLSHNLDRIGKGGTRHAAALGLSEVCDALILVVSEERGTISLAEQGTLRAVDSLAGLKDRLEAFYEGRYPVSRDHGWRRAWRRHLALKVLSLGLAGLFWFFAAYRPEASSRTAFKEVGIEFRNAGHLNLDAEPSQAKVTLTGSDLAFANAGDLKNLKVLIDLKNFKEGEYNLELSEKLVSLPTGLSVQQFDPPKVKVRIYKEVTRTVPIKAVWSGSSLPKGFEKGDVEITPKEVTLLVRDFGQPLPAEVETEQMDLTKIKQTITLTPKLELPPNCEFPGGKMPEVRVTIQVKKKGGVISANSGP